MIKTIGMMRIIAETYTLVKKLLQSTQHSENPLSLNEITVFMQTEMSRMSRMKELEPRKSDEEIRMFFDTLSADIAKKVQELEEK